MATLPMSNIWSMSALPPRADIAESDWHVRLVPKADIVPPPFDQLYDFRPAPIGPVSLRSSFQCSPDGDLCCCVLVSNGRRSQREAAEASAPKGFKVWYQVGCLMILNADIDQVCPFE
jgi:hypothetical protein